MAIKNCEICGSKFDAIGNTKLCKLECKLAYKQMRKNAKERKINLRSCEVCGKSLCDKNVSAVICSYSCYLKKVSRERIEKRKLQRKPTQCLICKKDFLTRYNREFLCSPECKNTHKSQQSKIHHAKHRPVYTKKCSICDQEFVSGYSKKVTCSDDCRKIANRIRASEKNKIPEVALKRSIYNLQYRQSNIEQVRIRGKINHQRKKKRTEELQIENAQIREKLRIYEELVGSDPIALMAAQIQASINQESKE